MEENKTNQIPLIPVYTEEIFEKITGHDDVIEAVFYECGLSDDPAVGSFTPSDRNNWQFNEKQIFLILFAYELMQIHISKGFIKHIITSKEIQDMAADLWRLADNEFMFYLKSEWSNEVQRPLAESDGQQYTELVGSDADKPGYIITDCAVEYLMAHAYFRNFQSFCFVNINPIAIRILALRHASDTTGDHIECSEDDDIIDLPF